MRQLLLRRIMTLPIVLFGVAVVLFVASQILPTDIPRLIAGDSITPELRTQIEVQLGLDQPVWVQFWDFLGRLVQGDLGTSIRFRLPVSSLIGQALPATLSLIICSTIIAVLLAFPLGILAARYRGSWFDLGSRGLMVLGTSTPPFFLGILAILFFSHHLGWLPASGRGDPPDPAHLILPSIVLGLREAGTTMRILRARMIDELGEDHAKASRARGVPRRTVLVQNGFRNALVPAVTDLGVSLTELAGAVILVETVFSWPGIGNLLYIGVQWNDFPLVSGTVLVLVLYAVLVNLLVDILYAVIDPRVRIPAVTSA
jgi:ABC-type dipeptide/oligopeptide/nickel transport system permease component